jgi:hypothetical protein
MGFNSGFKGLKIKKFPAFCEIRKFVSVFPRTYEVPLIPALNRMFSPHSPTLLFFRINFNIILPFRPTSLTFFSFRFSYKTLCTFPSHPRYGLRPATFRRSDNPDNIWLAVQIVKFLIALFSLAICYFVLPSLNPFVLSTQFSSTLCMKPRFTSIQNNRQGYSFTYFNFFSTADGNTK